MGVGEQRRPLLGRLAGLAWFTRHGEIAATQSLAILLEEPRLQARLLCHLGQRARTDLASVASFHAERSVDGGRSDLEGEDSSNRPLLVVEAKFGATLSSDQVRTYLTDQERRLDGVVRGVLVLLVPSYRVPEAEAILLSLEEGRAFEDSVAHGMRPLGSFPGPCRRSRPAGSPLPLFGCRSTSPHPAPLEPFIVTTRPVLVRRRVVAEIHRCTITGQAIERDVDT
jgi:hypothetical protein